MNIQVDAQLSGTRYYLNMSDSNLFREIATEKPTRDVFNLSLHSKLCNIQVNVLSSDAHLRIPNNEIWIIVLDDFQPAWDFAWILHKNRETQQDFFLTVLHMFRFLDRSGTWMLSDLADFDHI